MNPLRRLFCFPKRAPQDTTKRSLSNSSRMAGSATSGALYAVTVSASAVAGGTPEEAKEKSHHLKNGKGFHNPWDSCGTITGPQIGKAMVG